MSKNIKIDARTVLLGAAAAIRTRGHCKFMLQDKDGRMCAVGAMIVTAGDDIEARDEAIGIMGMILPPRREERGLRARVADWNNDRDREPEEVIQMLERAAEAL